MQTFSMPTLPAANPDAMMSAPAALRNRDVIREHVLRFAPESGRALEIASGTGEHVVHIAAATPGLLWHPTDPDPDRRASIAAWQADARVPNIQAPVALDATQAGWSDTYRPMDIILLVNLLHLISAPQAETVLTEIASALAPGGTALIYGPFLREGQTTSDGDAAFDTRLRAQNPEIGYKDAAEILQILRGAGLGPVATLDMPANNLLFAAQKAQTAVKAG